MESGVWSYTTRIACISNLLSISNLGAIWAIWSKYRALMMKSFLCNKCNYMHKKLGYFIRWLIRICCVRVKTYFFQELMYRPSVYCEYFMILGPVKSFSSSSSLSLSLSLSCLATSGGTFFASPLFIPLDQY